MVKCWNKELTQMAQSGGNLNGRKAGMQISLSATSLYMAFVQMEKVVKGMAKSGGKRLRAAAQELDGHFQLYL